MLAQAAELPLRPRGEPVELHGVEPVVALGDAPESTPQGQLSGHARDETLELDHGAERRIAGDAAVQLEATQLLARPGRGDLQPVRPHVEAAHDRAERLAVLLDLVGELPEEPAQLGALVLPRRPPRQLQAGGGPRKVVLEIYGE